MRQCKAGILKEYEAYTDGLEVPWEFHAWTCVSILAAQLGRSVWLDLGHFKEYPNLYTVLVAKSGVKKSTAAKIGLALFKEANQDETNVVDGKITMPELLRELSVSWEQTGEAKAYVFANEYKVFTDAGMSSGSTLLADMTTLWDCLDNFSYRTKGEKIKLLNNVCINMIACSTPGDISTTGGKDFINSGFSARNLYVYHAGSPIKKYPFPSKPKGWQALHNNLLTDLIQVGRISGGYVLTDVARAEYERWYMIRDVEAPDEKLQGYFNRRPQYVLKLCMILAAQEYDLMVVEARHIRASIRLLESLEGGISQAYQSIGYHDHDEVRLRILDQLNKNGLMSHKQIIRANQTRLRVKEIEEIVEGMVNNEEIIRSISRKSTKTTTIYHLNAYLGQDDFAPDRINVSRKASR